MDAHYPTALPAGRRPPRRSKPSPPSPHHARHVTGNTPISTTPRSPLSVIRYVPSPAMHVAHLSAPPPPALLSHFLSSPARAHTNGSLTLPLLLLRPAHNTPLRNYSPLPPHHNIPQHPHSPPHTHNTILCRFRALSPINGRCRARGAAPFKASRPRVQPPERGLQAASI